MAGGRVFEESFAALAPFGRIVAYGISSREQNSVRTGKLLRTSRSVVGFWCPTCSTGRDGPTRRWPTCSRASPPGELRAVVGATYPLAEAAQAQIDLAERRTTGKLLLDPSA